MDSAHPLEVVETTIETIHAAFRSGHLSARQLVQAYLDRIEAYDKQGSALNAIISLNPGALKDADRLDALFKTSGSVGSLHGIPVVMKDQGDVKGLPTTMGWVDEKGAPHLNTFLVLCHPSWSRRALPETSCQPG